MATDTPPLQFVFKTASRCNLNCSYCYVYNKGNESWRERPAFMADDVFEAGVSRIRSYCETSMQSTVTVSFHGGEPCLIGAERFAERCAQLRRELGQLADVRLVLQTNGTLLDEEWAAAITANDVEVGVSVDGVAAVHDANRVDHGGRGSYERVRGGLATLSAADVPFSILSVIQLGADGAAAHRHLLGLDPAGINYLFPDFTHDSIDGVRAEHGRTPCWDFLQPIFDEWIDSWPPKTMVPLFWNVVRLVMGGRSDLDVLGNERLPFVFVQADGSLEGLDVLGVCGEEVPQTGLNVLTDEIAAIGDTDGFPSKAIFSGTTLPRECRGCAERETCGGGYLPHRHSLERGFDNPSVWCADLLAFFAHVRRRLGVPSEETPLRREALGWVADQALTAS